MNYRKRLSSAAVLSVLLGIFVIYSGCVTIPPEAPVQLLQTTDPLIDNNVKLVLKKNTLSKSNLCVGAVVPVFRDDPRSNVVGNRSAWRDQVAKIRITKIAGESDVEGVVIEGNVANGDIASLVPNY